MNVFGYVTSRQFSNFVLPVPAQNACLREYARSIDATYTLPPLEHYFDNCYMQLFTVINSLSEADILAIYSVSMLPEDNTKLENIVDLVFNKKASFYFILEAKKVSFWSELSPVLFSYRLRNILDEMEQPTLKFLRDIR